MKSISYDAESNASLVVAIDGCWNINIAWGDGRGARKEDGVRRKRHRIGIG